MGPVFSCNKTLQASPIQYQNFYVEDGTVEFSNNNLLILTSTAKDLSEVDRKFLEISLSEAEKKITNSDITDKERYILSYKIETLKNINL